MRHRFLIFGYAVCPSTGFRRVKPGAMRTFRFPSCKVDLIVREQRKHLEWAFGSYFVVDTNNTGTFGFDHPQKGRCTYNMPKYSILYGVRYVFIVIIPSL